MSYIPVFPAFYKLRKIDTETPRPFKVSGSDGILKVYMVLPMIIIIISLIFTAIPLQYDKASLTEQLPITIGAIIFIVIGELIIKFKKIRLDTETTFHQYINTLNDTLKQSSFFVNPKLGITWEINPKNRISTSFSLNKTNTKVLNIYNNYINTGFRSFLKGTGSLNLLNASLATLNHTYGNWGDKFFANTYIIYSKNHEYISTNSIVSQNYSQSENIIIKDKNFLLFSSNIDKYFKPILTNLKLTIGGTKSNFQNIVNNSDLRTVINSSFNYGFELRSSFKNFLNFNIGSKWEYNEVKTIFINSYNENNSFIDLYFILNKKINFQLETERYYNSNLDKKNNKYYFMDLELNYVPNKNKLSFSILANNLFNTKTFKNYLVDDVSISKTEYRLLPRYILLKIDFRF